MATYTQHLNLIKPALDDDADVEQINLNMDRLDAAIHALDPDTQVPDVTDVLAQMAEMEQAAQAVEAAAASINSRAALSHADASAIPAGTDYDTLTAPGNYVCAADAAAQGMTHGPAPLAHRLFVYSTTENEKTLQLALVNSPSGPQIRCRIKTGAAAWAPAGGWLTIAAQSDLMALQAALTAYYPYAGVTPGISKTNSGVTMSTTVDGKLMFWGTATGTRRICCLNGNDSIRTTATEFLETLPAGVYRIAWELTGADASVDLEYTYTGFADPTSLPNGEITFDQPVMIGMKVVQNASYGTEEDPCYLSFSAQRRTGVDVYARESSVHTIPQRLTDAQKDQARQNIRAADADQVGELIRNQRYNAQNVLPLKDLEETESQGITRSVDQNVYTLSGTTSTNVRYELYRSQYALPDWFQPGKTLRILLHKTGSVNDAHVLIRKYVQGVLNNAAVFDLYGDAVITVPDDFDGTGLLMQLAIGNGKTVDGTVTPEALTGFPPVLDVRVDGVSVVDGGVANVPLAEQDAVNATLLSYAALANGWTPYWGNAFKTEKLMNVKRLGDTLHVTGSTVDRLEDTVLTDAVLFNGASLGVALTSVPNSPSASNGFPLEPETAYKLHADYISGSRPSGQNARIYFAVTAQTPGPMTRYLDMENERNETAFSTPEASVVAAPYGQLAVWTPETNAGQWDQKIHVWIEKTQQ